MKNLLLLTFCAMALSWPFNASANRLVGDVDGDGIVGIADVTMITDVLLSHAETAWSMVCDVDGDGAVTISDVTWLIDMIMAPPSPQSQDVTLDVNGVNITMVLVEGGTFTMGATPDQWPDHRRNEVPLHEVTLSSYYISQTEVTQELWEAVMGFNPSQFAGDPQRPVEMVSLFDCARFVDKLTEITGRVFRMPTEAEWEYAARGGNRSQSFKYSGSNMAEDVAWYNGNADNTTHPVATKAPNELGIYDMSGNVLEWCQDWYASYDEGPCTNPVGPESGYENVYRGGSWNNDSVMCRNATRDMADPHTTSNMMGLRVVMNY